MTAAQPILLVGYSMRMLAELAVRAGYAVTALDYFGDSDLRALSPSLSLLRDFGGKSYNPTTLTKAARTLAAPSVAYSASFENHPALVAQLAEGRTLLGNPPAVLERVRDPLQLAAALRAGGFNYPETVVAQPDTSLDPNRRWLWKPLRGGGGTGVRRASAGAGRNATTPGVFQERLDGLVCSAAFVADGRRAVLLGLTEQLVGRRAFGVSGYRYCGNLLPPRLPPAAMRRMLREARALADHLTAAFGLRGVNGVDFVWHQGRLWTIEVNPRPSASLELMDSGYNIRVFDAHVRAFSGELPAFDLERAWAHTPAMGKAILFTTPAVRAPDTSDWFARGLRDVPHSGEAIGRGHPVCTLLVSAATPAACLRGLRAKAAQVRSWLVPNPPP